MLKTIHVNQFIRQSLIIFVVLSSCNRNTTDEKNQNKMEDTSSSEKNIISDNDLQIDSLLKNKDFCFLNYWIGMNEKEFTLVTNYLIGKQNIEGDSVTLPEYEEDYSSFYPLLNFNYKFYSDQDTLNLKLSFNSECPFEIHTGIHTINLYLDFTKEDIAKNKFNEIINIYTKKYKETNSYNNIINTIYKSNLKDLELITTEIFKKHFILNQNVVTISLNKNNKVEGFSPANMRPPYDISISYRNIQTIEEDYKSFGLDSHSENTKMSKKTIDEI